MIPFFHASGQFLYAKSSHLYLQDMSKLNIESETNMNSLEFNKFCDTGFLQLEDLINFGRVFGQI